MKITVAESCTSGLVAAELGRVPGASRWFCGSAVVYRNQTKTDWLGVPKELLDDPQIGPVSEPVAAAMCEGLLRRTSEANWAFSITGHLGPNAPAGLDGILFIASQPRNGSPTIHPHQLPPPSPTSEQLPPLRHLRQQTATKLVLQTILEGLSRRIRLIRSTAE
ncbi:MAG: nicotinamide-nucleotide amidohydrolase family protein [Planctomycetaceae bacterium]